MILPKKDDIKENISNITSGFNAKVKKETKLCNMIQNKSCFKLE